VTRRRFSYFIAGGIALLDAVYRMFEGTRPIDWLILGTDGLVLSVIILFEGPEWWHKRRATKKAKLLLPLIESGRRVQSSVPYQDRESTDELFEWAESAKSWWANAEITIAALSPQAATAFTYLRNVESADRFAIDKSGRPYRLSGYAGDIYQSLQLRLGNLQRIIEDPETYF